MKFKTRKYPKLIIRFIVGGAAGSTLKHFLEQNIENDEDSRLDPATHYVGIGILSWIAQDYVGRYTDELIDDMIDGYHEARQAIAETSE
jgi:hypothetical protein